MGAEPRVRRPKLDVHPSSLAIRPYHSDTDESPQGDVLVPVHQGGILTAAQTASFLLLSPNRPRRHLLHL